MKATSLFDRWDTIVTFILHYATNAKLSKVLADEVAKHLKSIPSLNKGSYD